MTIDLASICGKLYLLKYEFNHLAKEINYIFRDDMCATNDDNAIERSHKDINAEELELKVEHYGFFVISEEKQSHKPCDQDLDISKKYLFFKKIN